MDIVSESIYLRTVDRIIESIGGQISPELKTKVSKIWKAKISLAARKSRNHLKIQTKREASKKIENSDSDSLELLDEEFLLPETTNICGAILKKIQKKPDLWTLQLSGCIIKIGNHSEYVFPHITALLTSNLS